MKKIKSLCVYCGSNFNGDETVRKVVRQLAEILVKEKINLIYGGGSVGIMGVLSNDVLALGGTVIGVIPQFLMDKEVGHQGLTEMIVTENMHQRKQKMADLSDGFMVLPGGFGTLEEFFEVLTWLQLGLHNKPIGILNINGFYDSLFEQMEVMVQHKFLKTANRDMVFNEANPAELILKMDSFSTVPDDVWFKDKI